MNIGIALSGGAVRGFAHLGILRALNEMGLCPTHYTGASAGSIVGAFMAAEYSPQEAFDLIVKTNLTKSLRPAFSRMGLMKLAHMEALLARHLPATFAELPLPLTINATDLERGESVYFSEGPLASAILASCCLPGIFEPIGIDGRQLVDGGVLNNLPVEPLEAAGCDLLIGCHVNPVGVEEQPFTSMKGVLYRSLYLAAAKTTHQKIGRVHLFLEPPGLDRFGLFDLRRAGDIFETGYRYALHRQREIQGLIQEKLTV